MTYIGIEPSMGEEVTYRGIEPFMGEEGCDV